MLNRTGAVIYVGGLPDDIRERELDDLFYKVRAGASARQAGAQTMVCMHMPALPPANPYGPSADRFSAGRACEVGDGIKPSVGFKHPASVCAMPQGSSCANDACSAACKRLHRPMSPQDKPPSPRAAKPKQMKRPGASSWSSCRKRSSAASSASI